MGKKIVVAIWKEKMAEGKKKIEAHVAKVRAQRSEAKSDHHKSGDKHPGKEPHKGMGPNPWGPSGSSGWGRGRVASPEEVAEARKKMRELFAKMRGGKSHGDHGKNEAGHHDAKAPAKKCPCGKAGCKGQGKAKAVAPEKKKTPHGDRFEAFRKRMADLHKRGVEARKTHKAHADDAKKHEHPVTKPVRPHTRTRTAAVKAVPARDTAATNKRIDELSNQIDRLINAAQKIQHELKELKK